MRPVAPPTSAVDPTVAPSTAPHTDGMDSRLPAPLSFANIQEEKQGRADTRMPAVPARTRVVKKLDRRQPGALGWARHYGDALVCVRYRVDAAGEHRYTTVELLVDSAPVASRSNGSAIVGIPIDYNDIAMRQRLNTAGAQWDNAAKLWRLPYR